MEIDDGHHLVELHPTDDDALRRGQVARELGRTVLVRA